MTATQRPTLSALTRRSLGASTLLALLSLPTAHAQEAKPDADPAVAAIQKAGGKVERDEKAEGQPITVVNFATTQAGDDDLTSVKGLVRLQKLTLNNTKVTDAGLENLKGLAGLEKLYLVDTNVTDAGLAHLKGLTKLRVLSLVGTKVTDAGLDHLKDLKDLQIVFLAATPVTDEGVKKLKEALPNVKVEK